MISRLIDKIEEKIGVPAVTGGLFEKLSGSELNSLLLALFRQRSYKVTPSALLQQFSKNRFCLPSDINPVEFLESEIEILRYAEGKGFKPLQLSPLTLFGTCSSMGRVDQNNVVTALRETEVVSDAANVLALKTALDLKEVESTGVIKYCTCHRHVRAQSFTDKNFSSHFTIFCMATGGKALADNMFQIDSLNEHVHFISDYLLKFFPAGSLLLKVFIYNNPPSFTKSIKEVFDKAGTDTGIKVQYSEPMNSYYSAVQFRFFLNFNNELLNLADGGFTDWLQKLINNRKMVFIISAIGIELIYKIKSGMVQP